MKTKTIYGALVIAMSLIFLQFGSVLGISGNEIEKKADAKAAKSRETLRKELQDLVDSEKAFSATAVAEGFRDSFIKFFADDGIGFGPGGPERTKENLQKAPAPPGPRRVIFSWQPMVGDISLAGDMGYTTGPLLYKDTSATPRPPRHGLYFSVWQKQADGSWKVAIDMGSNIPEAAAPIDVGFTQQPNSKAVTQKDVKKLSATDFSSLDQAFSADIAKSGIAKAYADRLDANFRIHRNGIMPVNSKEGLTKLFEGKTGKMTFTYIDGKIAQSKDLAYTYGSFESADQKENGGKGYYVHVWRREKSGKWKLVSDIAS